MLKNKFGMTTRVLLIVLSVLMAVSLAACKKDDGISSDDMNSAIQSAIDAANKAQEEQNKALQSSIAAKEEAEAAQKAAEASSIAAQIKAQEDALKKAQEEADAAKKAAEAASKAAADAAAKAKAEAEQAAKDAAAKAASEAAKKAEESMKALESALKAQEEALKKAQEEAEAAKKAAEEASKRAEEAMSKAEETTVAPETTVVPATKPAETTVAPETTAPIVMEDKTDVLTAYSKLKTEYTYTKQDMYNAAEYAELVLLFDHASVELNNAVTLDAATSIYNTLVVDVAAVRNVANAAAEVAALVNALGDIETEVFTTQATKIKEAKDAYTALKKEYATYFKAQIAADEKGKTTNDTVATKLGINVADLNKAIDKEAVLVSYIESALYEDMKTLFLGVNKKITSYDAEEDFDLHTTVNDAYYKYLVLSVVNGGDYGKGLEIDWEYLTVDGEKVLGADVDYLDPWGNSYGAKARVYDTEKAIEWFTVEELLDVFVLPTLDYKLALYIENEDETGLLNKFKAAVGDEGYFATKDAEDSIYVDIYSDIDNELNNVYEALEDELLALTFSEDFKGNVTFDDAKDEVAAIAIKAYIEALNVYFEEAKAIAIAAEEENVKNLIDGNEDLEIVGWQEKIDEVNTKLDADNLSAAAIERYNNTIAGYKAKIDKLNADLDAFKANVEAATLLTYEEMLTEEVAESDAYKTVWVDLTKIHAVYGEDKTPASSKIVTFLNTVLTKTITANFTSTLDAEGVDQTVEELNNLVDYVLNELYTLRARISPYAEDEDDADIFNLCVNPTADDKDKKYLRGTAETYLGDYYFSNTPVFEEAVAIIDAAIDAVEAETADKYEDSDEKLPYADNKDKKYYFKNAAAQAYAVENEMSTLDVLADTSLWTTTATDYPITYVYTAAEKAANAVATLYLNAFKAVNAKLVTLDPVSSGYRKLISNEGKSGVTKTDYDNLVSVASGDLKTEMTAVATTSLNSITSAVTTFKYQFTDDKEWKTTHFFEIKGKLNDTKIDTDEDGTADTFVLADIVQIKIPTDSTTGEYISLAEDYQVLGYEGNLASTVATFNSRFWIDVNATKNNANSKVYDLWTKKLAMIDKIEEDIEDYKNQYTAMLGDDAGKYVVDSEGTIYPYVSGDDVILDVTGEEGAPTTESLQILNKFQTAIDYEAALDQLVKDYSAKIMAVKISSGYLKIVDGTNAVVKNGANDAYKWNGKDSGDDKGTQVNYDLTKAQAALDAYYEALFGEATKTAVPNNDPTHPGYANGNSEIFKQYNSIILGNTYGYAVK